FLSGSRWNADTLGLPPGLFIFESTGSDNDFGVAPAFVCEFNGISGEYVAEQFQVADVDGDGRQAILLPGNPAGPYPGGGSAHDLFYIFSVGQSFEPGGYATSFASCNEELTLARGATASDNGYFDFNFLGGGSPYAMHAADLDGDGTLEI